MAEYLKKNRFLIVVSGIVLVILLWIVTTMEAKVWSSILLSGITLASLYFLIASGLSLIFGLMDVLNFAHGALFVLGAYVGLSVFMNPRLLFNTLPLFLMVLAGVVLGNHFGIYAWRRLKAGGVRRVLWWVLFLGGVALLVYALQGFPIRSLNAFNVTAVGGVVPTEKAQDPLNLMVWRCGMLLIAGLPLGVITAPRERYEETRRRELWQVLLITALLIGASAILLFQRGPGEVFMLGLSVDLRFLLGIMIGAAVGALVGAAIEVVLIRPFYGRPVTQLVLTLGLLIVLTDMIEAIWGEEGNPPMQPPSLFAESCRSDNLIGWFSERCASVNVLGRAFPTYRLFIISVGVLVFFGVLLLLQRTRIGMIIRAGVQDSEMVQALGINVRRVFTLVFALGSALAAVGGVIAAPFLGVYPAMGATFQLQAFIAVVIGGMGSYVGAAVGTLILGLARAFGDHFVASGIQLPFMDELVSGSPAIAKASTVLIMAIVLLVRPAGLFGKKE